MKAAAVSCVSGQARVTSSSFVASDNFLKTRDTLDPSRMSSRPDRIGPPSCPKCQSTQTIQTFENFGERVFFCSACEHTWAKRPGKRRAKKR